MRKKHDRLFLIGNPLIETDCGGVFAPNHQLNLRRTHRPKPVLSGSHEKPSKTFALARRLHGEVVDPTAMTVEADHDRPNNLALVTHSQDDQRRTLNRPLKVSLGVVPRTRESYLRPKRDGSDPVGFTQLFDEHRPMVEEEEDALRAAVSHSTFLLA